MKNQDIIMASAKELKRLHIVKMLFEKKIGQKEAAGLLDLSTRQVRRIAERIKL
jgi:Trp operon repressor